MGRFRRLKIEDGSKRVWPRHTVSTTCRRAMQRALHEVERAMLRVGAIIFSDPTDKLDVLRVACDKCGRAGCYRIGRLIGDRGYDAKLVDWLVEIAGDCPKRVTVNWNDQCRAQCPQLPKVL